MFQDIHHYHTIEIEKGTKLPELTGDLKESLKSLALHPAFQYLTMRFRLKKAGMENALREGIQLTETQLRYLQAGIFWSGEIERDIQLLTQTRPQATPAPEKDAELFDKVRQSLELVGQ